MGRGTGNLTTFRMRRPHLESDRRLSCSEMNHGDPLECEWVAFLGM